MMNMQNYNQQEESNQLNPQNINHHDPNIDHSVQLSHLYVNRQINRHMLNPLYKINNHKLES